MYLALYILMLVLVDTDISVVAGSLELISTPATATDGELFTMMCTGNQRGDRAWSRDDVDPVFRTQPAKREFQLISPSLTADLVGRVTVSVGDDGTQHNVTLMINSRIDNGDVWRCTDIVRNDTSNTLTITKTTTVLVPTSMQTTLTGSSVSDPKAEGRLSSSTDIFSTTPSETTPSSSSSPTSSIVAVAASAAIIIAVVVVILCVRRYRRTRPRKDHQHSNIYATPSAYEDMNNLYCDLRTNHGLTEGETTPSSYANSTHHKKEEAIFTNSQDEATLSCYVNTV